MIDISGIDKAEVLAALYNASKPQGMGFMHYDSSPMTAEEARELLAGGTHFDYLKGRVMKINLGGDQLDEWAYDRDNGVGAAAAVISTLRSTHDTYPEEIEMKHLESTRQQAADTYDQLEVESSFDKKTATFRLGVADAAEYIVLILDEIMGDE
jgi:hypothetical protein